MGVIAVLGDVPGTHVYYEASIYILFFACLLHAWRTALGLRRLIAIALYGCIVETAAYVGMEAAPEFSGGVGRFYDAGKFVLNVNVGGHQIPIYMAPCWYVVTMYAFDVAARRMYTTQTFLGRWIIAATLAISVDIPIEPVASMHGFWRYRVAKLPYEHWGGIFWVNTIAWIGLQGAISASLHVHDRAIFKRLPSFMAIVTSVLLAQVFLSGWFAVMTLARPPHGLIKELIFSDSRTVAALACLAVPFTLYRRGGSSSAGPALWPMLMAVAFHAIHLGLLVVLPCDSQYKELCESDGLMMTVAYSAFSLSLFLPPSLTKSGKKSE